MGENSGDKDTYCWRKDCQNCMASNSIHIPKGVKVEDHLLNTVKGRDTCHNCGCHIIEHMVKE